MLRFVRGLFILTILVSAWHFGFRYGYNKAAKDLEGQWYEGPEGYCLQQNHPGSCAEVKVPK